MYKYLRIDDFIHYEIYNFDKCRLIITNNKLSNNCNNCNNCNIYIYEIEKKNKLYYLYYSIDNYDYKQNNNLIYTYINNIEKKINNKLDYEYIDCYKTLNYLLKYLNEQCIKIHKKHYLIKNSNKNKNSKMYYIHHIDKLINYN